MPARYIQAIYNQYHLFTKSQEAQQAAASEEMMEELEDGAMYGGGSPRSNKKETKKEDMMSVREQQLKTIRENIARAQSEDPEVIYRNNVDSNNSS